MSNKILTDRDLIDIVNQAKDYFDCEDSYMYFLDDLAQLLTSHFGGGLIAVLTSKNGGYKIHISHDEAVPKDGGIYKNYDVDINWNRS